MKKYLILLFTLSLTSCEKSQIENLLIDDNKKWVYIDNPETLNRPHSAYAYLKFFRGCDCENRIFENDDKYTLLDGKDVSCRWIYHNEDSLLDVYGFRFKVSRFTTDTIYLLRKDNSKAFLINMK